MLSTALPSVGAVLGKLRLSGFSLVDVPAEGIELVERTLRASGRTASAAMILSTDQLLWGLYLLSLRHQRLRVKEILPGTETHDVALVAELLRDTVLADAAYADTREDLVRRCGLDDFTVVSFTRESNACQPAYYVAMHHPTQCVLLVIRGTRSKFDVLTDLHAESTPLPDGGHAHAGMLEAARWLLDHECVQLAELMRANPGYQLKVVGHSLGAGTAALVALFLRTEAHLDEEARARVWCTAVAAPPCLSFDLAASTAPFVTSVVLDDDVIPRTSLLSLFNLQVETLETDWRTDIPEGKWKKDFLTAVAAAHTALEERRVESLKSVDALAKRMRAKAGEQSLPQPSNPLVAKALSRVTAALAYEPRSSLGAIVKRAVFADMSVGAEPEKAEAAGPAYPTVPGARSKHAPPAQMALFSPGRLLHVVTDGEAAVRVIDGFPGICFQRICLSSTMLSDHRTEAYVAALKKAAQGR